MKSVTVDYAEMMPRPEAFEVDGRDFSIMEYVWPPMAIPGGLTLFANSNGIRMDAVPARHLSPRTAILMAQALLRAAAAAEAHGCPRDIMVRGPL